MIGKSISHYKILEKLGEGGMGVVYKAQDLKLDRLVALKFLPQQITVSKEDKARFLQEAKAASAVMHPNVCVIYDITEHKGQQFIIMEYVDGKTLRQMVPIQKLQIAIDYVIQIGEALQEAHSKGVVHRDVKTDNIMVNTRNQIKVMDFGLAKLKGSLKLTKTSSTVGTLAYMSPEQIQGAEVDARSDIFSFGVVLYEMLTGHLPFHGEYEAAMMYCIVNEEPQPVHKYRPEISSEVLHILNRSLEKDPEDRYQSVHDMIIELRRVKKETSRVSRSPLRLGTWTNPREGAIGQQDKEMPGIRQKRPKVLFWIGLAGIAVLIAAIFILFLMPGRTVKLNHDLTVHTLEISLSDVFYASLSRDGSWAAFSARDANKEWSIYFMNVAKADDIRRLTSEPFRYANYAEISPNGSEVMYDKLPSEGYWGVYIISSNGGVGRRIAEPGRAARWRPDGALIGYIKSGNIYYHDPSQSGKREFWSVKPDGSDNHLLFTDSLSYLWGFSCFDWSPNGKSIAWLRSFPDYGEIFIRDLESGREHQLTSYKKEINEMTWASNDQIFFSSNKGGNTNIWMIPAKGGEAVQVTKGSGPDECVRVSADAKRLLFTENRRISHLWTAQLDGSNARQLTFDNQNLSFPILSPDDGRVLFDMSSSDFLRPGSHIYMIDNDGTKRIQLTAGDALFYDATCSPDGKYLTYSSRLVDEHFDSSRIYISEISRPEVSRLIGKGIQAYWLGPEKFVIIHPYPKTYTSLFSVNNLKLISETPDSTWEFPLQDGKTILRGDTRKGKEGWWLHIAGDTNSAADRQIMSSEYLYFAWPSISFRYLLYRQTNGELWRMSLPDGKRERLAKIFKGYNPHGGFSLSMSYDDQQVVWLKERLDTRLILIENLFK
jgi:serine/threonine protein kinase